MEGRIIGLNCGYYSVLSDGMIFKVKARGAFRNKSIKYFNKFSVEEQLKSLDHSCSDRVPWFQDARCSLEE